MQLAGVALAFGSIMYLVSKSVSMGVSLLIGTSILGLLSGLGLAEFASVVAIQGVFNRVTIELVIAVALVSGLGKLMKESGDLKLTVDALVALFRNPKILSMMVPSLIGTLNVPGGAIMSAPMVEENSQILGLDATTKAAINVFFRHIGYFVYPLYAATIIFSELFGMQKSVLIRHNIITMLVALAIAYWLFFRGVEPWEGTRTTADSSTMGNIKNFLLGFSPILVSLALVLIFDLPFYLALAAGVLLALTRALPANKRLEGFASRVRKLFVEWIDYKLVLTIIGLMTFKAVIEASGAVSGMAEALLAYGIPLPMMVVVLGVLAALLTGNPTAATGILAALFVPLVPEAFVGPYVALLFTSMTFGYILSPIHLCLILTNEYFGASYGPVARKLLLPGLATLAVAIIQLLILT